MAGVAGQAADTSVILTCHNERDYILAALGSVLEQTAIERVTQIIVVDDGSTDGSAELIADFSTGEPRVELVRSTGGGVAAARNLALKRATGPIVAVLDGDDLWCPNKLEIQLPVFDKYPSVGLVYSDYYEFDDGRPDALERCHARSYRCGHKNLLRDYYVFDAPIIPSSMLVRKAVFDDVGTFDPNLRVGEDTEMCLRIAERYEFHHVAESVVRKRRHPRSLSSQQDRLWPNHLHISELYAERNPELKPLIKKRLSRRAAKVGWGMIQVGDRKRAAAYLFRSMRYDPRQLRIYIYACLAVVPRPVALHAHRFLAGLRGKSQAGQAL